MTLLLVAIGVISIIFAVIVLIASSRLIDSIFFVGFAVFMGLWSVAIGLFLATSDVQVAELSATIYYAAALMLIYNLFLFSIRYTLRDALTVPAYLQLGLISAVPVLAVVVFVVMSGAMFDSFSAVSDHSVYLNPIWYAVYSLCFVIYGALVVYVLHKGLRGHMLLGGRNDAKAVFWTISTSLIIATMPNLILPLFGEYRFIHLGPLLILPVLIVFFYAIIRYSLFDLRLAFVRSAAYIASIALLGAIYLLAAVGLPSWFFDDAMQIDVSIYFVILSFLLFIIFQPVRRFFDGITDRLFYRDNYSENDFFSKFTRLLVTGRELRSLLERASIEIADTLKAEQVFFTVFRGEGRYVTAGTVGYDRMSNKDALILAQAIGRSSKVVTADQFASNQSVKRLLLSYRITLVVPLRRGSELLGFLMLGEHKGRPYTARDLRVLETISDELTIAIENAVAVQEVKELNATLQQRIDDATDELRRSNAELQRLDQAKDDFVSMASHQLRTPLTSVKGYISMVLDGDVGEVSPEQQKLLSEAFTSSNRMVHLINDFLNVSRLQTGKFMLDRQLTDLAQLVRQEVVSLQSTAKSRDLKIVCSIPKVMPKLYIDEGKMRQVVMNFIDNAMYYSPAGSRISVKVEIVDDNLEVTVKDAGMGVPQEEQANLFTKFFRASNARRQRPDGTGVGLFLAKRVVYEHGGRIIFHSKEGKGSTFGFSLPVKRLSLAPDEEAN